MLKQEDKIFKNLYNELGWEIDNSLKRDDWKGTKDLISKGILEQETSGGRSTNYELIRKPGANNV